MPAGLSGLKDHSSFERSLRYLVEHQAGKDIPPSYREERFFKPQASAEDLLWWLLRVRTGGTSRRLIASHPGENLSGKFNRP
jgi:hypothetical protein